MAQLNPQQAVEQVDAASIVARCVSVAAKAPASSKPDRTDVAESYARQAVELLRKALAVGFKELEKVKADPAFAALHDRADFKALQER